ncbi:hypothetical protein DPMN_152123 [Dreissena polymorpha]|uniref:Uncharacterized protein n=1 Tax=Dreissena polymorpha TaxID=45954 RepID=A0A9D4FJU0_DREPO|nr:hypothetical protein DPMN_152123 [Dreissena polymorpha]
MSNGKLKRGQRKATRSVQGKLFFLWERYIQKEISASRLLTECAHVYGPAASGGQ